MTRSANKYRDEKTGKFLKGSSGWTDEKINLLKQLYPDTQTKDLCQLLGFSINTIYNKAYELNLKKSKAFLESEKSGILIKGHTKGIATQFKKGNIPHTKGKKLNEFLNIEAIEKFKQNSFKEGNLPHNTKSDGVISIRNMKGRSYKWIRISQNKWDMLHRVLWIETYGEIPAGFNVQFKDKNSLNCVIENLYLISKKQSMADNTIINYPLEIIQSIHTLNKLKKVIHGKEQNN